MNHYYNDNNNGNDNDNWFVVAVVNKKAFS
jgi:hypothetical protein